jgi:hypothetical protein
MQPQKSRLYDWHMHQTLMISYPSIHIQQLYRVIISNPQCIYLEQHPKMVVQQILMIAILCTIRIEEWYAQKWEK